MIFIEYIFLTFIFNCLFCVFCIVYFPIICIIFHFFVHVIFFIWGHDQAVHGRVCIDIPKFYKLGWLSNETKNTHFWNMQSFFGYLKCQTENWIPLSQSLLHKGWRFISNGRHLQKYKMSNLQVWPKEYNSKIQENFNILLANRNLSNRRRIYV